MRKENQNDLTGLCMLLRTRLILLLTKQKAAPGWGLLKRKVVFSIAIKEYSMSRDSTRQPRVGAAEAVICLCNGSRTGRS